MLEEGISTLPAYVCIALGARGVKSKRTQVKGPVWVCILGGSLRCAALLCLKCPRWVFEQGSVRGSGCGSLQWGVVGTSQLSEWGSPSVVLGGPSEAITFVLGSAGSFRAYLLSAHPFTLAAKC